MMGAGGTVGAGGVGEAAPLPEDKLTGVDVPAGEAATGGRLVSTDGMPLEGVRVLCCSSETCLVDTTNAAGLYLHIGIDPSKRYKMQVTGSPYSELLFYQPYAVDTLSILEEDVIVPVLVESAADWPADMGGPVTLAGGELVLTAAPEALDYPLGKPPEIAGQRIPIDQLPPYDPAPWGDGEGALAYVFTPATIEIETPAHLKITLAEPLTEGTIYAIWNVDSHTGDMVAAGTATVDAEGALVAEDSSEIKYFSTLVLFPMPQ